MKKVFIIVPLLLFLILAFIPSQSDAAGLVPCGGTGESACSLCHGFSLVKNIVDGFLFPIIPVIAGFFLVLGGMFLLAGMANPSALTQGRNVIIATLVGLLIIYVSWVVINTVLGFFGVTIFTGPGTWWQLDLSCAALSFNETRRKL